MEGLKNWKLKEVEEHVEVVATDSIQRRNELLVELGLPHSHDLTGLDRSETTIDWRRMPKHYQFFFDRHGWNEIVARRLKQSSLQGYSKVIVTYGWKEPMVRIPTEIFIEGWEDFFQSTKYETIVFSEDYRLIMEVSRDYMLHSNFMIIDPADAKVAGR